MHDLLEQLAGEVAAEAVSRRCRIVLAESCTAGLVAQLLSSIPGASNWLCGSAVVYRTPTKTSWLGVDAALLADPARGPVSSAAAAAMSAGVLGSTPEATLAASVTGHLGPHAPPELDGLIYVAVQKRDERGDLHPADVRSARLGAHLPNESPFRSLRVHRQHEAAANVLLRLIEALLRSDEPK